MAIPTFEQAAQLGFVFRPKSKWLTNQAVDRLMAQDAALTTRANSSVPANFLLYVSPDIVEILTAPERAREIMPEVKCGDWTIDLMSFRVEEMVGETAPYQDYGDGPAADVNSEDQYRQQYIFQTTVSYGDLEVDKSAKKRIDLINSKHRAAAKAINIDSNKFALLGVSHKRIYGFLNDPNLPAAINPVSVSIGGTAYTKWTDKNEKDAVTGPNYIFNDVRKLYTELSTNTAGIIDEDTPMLLLVSPTRSNELNAINQYGNSAKKMILETYKNIKIITVPQLSTEAGEKVILMLPELNGVNTAEIGYGIKARQGRLVADTSSFKQKFSASTFGCILKAPLAVATMLGV